MEERLREAQEASAHALSHVEAYVAELQREHALAAKVGRHRLPEKSVLDGGKRC